MFFPEEAIPADEMVCESGTNLLSRGGARLGASRRRNLGLAPIGLKLGTHLADQSRQLEGNPQLTVLGRLRGLKVDRTEVGNPAIDDHRFGVHIRQRTWGWILVDCDAYVDPFAAQERDIGGIARCPDRVRAG